MEEENPFAKYVEEENPFAKYVQPAGKENPFAKYVQPETPVAAASPPRTPQQPPSPVGPLPAAKDPWAGVNVDDLRRNAGMAVPQKPPPLALDNRPLMDRAVEAYQNAPRAEPGGNVASDFLAEYPKQAQGSFDTMTTGMNRIGQADSPFSEQAAQGALETFAGGLGYLFSPATAAISATFSKPVSRLTGVPERYGDIIGQTVAPGVGLVPMTRRTAQEMVAATPQARRALGNVKPAVAEAPPVAPEIPGAALAAKTESSRGTPLGQAPAAKNIPLAARYDNPIQAAAQTIEKVFSPSTVDDKSRAAANAFRQELGIAARENDIMAAALKKERDLIDTADQGTRNAFINYVEGRSAGAANPFPALQPLADTWRNIAQKFETQAIPRIDRLTGMNFVQDYFPHLWKDPNAAAQWFEMSGQGRGGFTKKRTLQLYADGLAAGLEPKYPNPVDAMEAYIVNANKYLAHERVFQFGKKNGYIKYLTPKAAGRVAQRLNLVPLKGRLGKSMGGPVSYTAYAPENFARAYNNMVDKGWTGAAGDLTRGLRQSANQITALELGFSGFHALTTAAESTIGRVSNAVTAVSRGRPITAMSEMTKAPLAPVLDAVKGAKLRSEYRNPGTGSPMVQRITDILTRAGARPGKQDEIHFASDRRGYLQGGFDATKALAKGRIGEAFDRMGQAIATTGRDLKDDVTSGFQVPGDYGRRNTSSAIAQTVSNVFKVTGNVLDTVMAPLFKVVVPTLKNGAMYRMVENFIQAYPNATDAEILEYARRAVDSVDNRFGEVVTENIAYPRYVKEGAQVALRSGSYAYGQIARELGGGAADFLSMPFRKGGIATPLWTEKMSYLIAMPIVSGAAAATTMYLMTGKWPSEWMDLYKPKSGGQTEDGDPERINMPGMMKEVIEPFNKGMWEHFKGKMSTFASTVTEVATGKDWKNESIAYTDAERAAHPRGDEFDPYFLAWAKHIFGKLVPITVRNLAEGQPPGSAITPAMTAFGFQRASKSASNPDKAEQFKAYRTKKEMDKKLKEKDRKEQWR